MNINLAQAVADTAKTVVDTVKTVADSTAVKTVTETVANTSIWQDKALMQTLAIIGGLLAFMVIILVTTRDKKEKK